MSQFITVLKIIFTALLVLNAAIWLIAQVSAPVLPLKENLMLGSRSLIFLALLLLSIYVGQKVKNYGH